MNPTLKESLTKYAKQKNRPDGSSYLSLSFNDENKIASLTGFRLKDVQIAALQDGIIPERYCRNQQSLSVEEQIILLQSHVVIVGQGGLGGNVTEILARIGLGRLTLVDGDIFEESNLNRQILSSLDSLGKNKAETGKIRVNAINPAVEVTVISEFLTKENASSILAEADIAIDCLDSIPSRFTLEDSCKTMEIPMISAAIGGAAGQAMVIFPKDKGLRQIYGDPNTAQEKGIEKKLGTLPYTATFMAAIECSEAVILLSRKSTTLQNKILVANIEEKNIEKISFM